MRAPPDKRKRWPSQPAPRNTLTAAQAKKGDHRVPDSANGVVVELAAHWAREHLAQAGLLADAPVPCGPGACWCYGGCMGAGCGP